MEIFDLEKAVGHKAGENLRDSLANLSLAIQGAAHIMDMNGEVEPACALLRMFWAFEASMNPLLEKKYELTAQKGSLPR